ncbi:unnamed protein product [Paramecium sonneborni]|uniref:Uncharacterized protein n=1 Tax=Paramecium sonneborni TaxID=65129 RepID=A0A8S1KLL4_9CILI|nr:unnamed protein product [Paramecium sonneborni]
MKYHQNNIVFQMHIQMFLLQKQENLTPLHWDLKFQLYADSF